MPGDQTPSIYSHTMPSLAWQLLWWLLCRMDVNNEVRFGWRAAAARDMRKDRQWLGICAGHLQKRGLIYTEPRRRYAKVLVANIVG